jgi:hypothetical protein
MVIEGTPRWEANCFQQAQSVTFTNSCYSIPIRQVSDTAQQTLYNTTVKHLEQTHF